MTARILHVSDLHMGKREDAEVERALAALVERIAPEVVVASGDLTNRGRRAEHERAHGFLGSLGVPVLAVPGNHDLPYTLPARITSPWAEFERLWETTEPTHASAALHVVGLNSAQPYRHQSGALSEAQLRRAAERLGEAAAGAYRVAVLHHHLLGAPWRAARKRPVSNRDRVFEALVSAGADLILAGHIHQAALAERREFEAVRGGARAAVISIAPGFGQPRPNRLGEARGLHVYEAGEASLTALTYVWRDGDWNLIARRTFPRGLGPLT
ncbi:MAG TPA: metallophosphoesterase [Gaiellaceae bacterium]|nr:metallophosphoesterase [Gaiellaceae bacterium]